MSEKIVLAVSLTFLFTNIIYYLLLKRVKRWKSEFEMKQALKRFTYDSLCSSLDSQGLKFVHSGPARVYTLSNGAKAIITKTKSGYDVEVTAQPMGLS